MTVFHDKCWGLPNISIALGNSDNKTINNQGWTSKFQYSHLERLIDQFCQHLKFIICQQHQINILTLKYEL